MIIFLIVVWMITNSHFPPQSLKDVHELDLPCFAKFPTFWYLTRLEVEAGVDKWLTLLHILEHCASLEALIFKKVSSICINTLN